MSIIKNFIAELDDLGGVFGLTCGEEFIIEGVIGDGDGESDDPDDDADGHCVCESQGLTDIGHHEAHSDAEDQCADSAEGEGEYPCGLFDLCVEGFELIELGDLFFCVLCADVLRDEVLIVVHNFFLSVMIYFTLRLYRARVFEIFRKCLSFVNLKKTIKKTAR